MDIKIRALSAVGLTNCMKSSASKVRPTGPVVEEKEFETTEEF